MRWDCNVRRLPEAEIFKEQLLNFAGAADNKSGIYFKACSYIIRKEQTFSMETFYSGQPESGARGRQLFLCE